MTFALVCCAIFFMLCVISDMQIFFKYVCIFMCLYAAYTVASHLGIVQDLFPDNWNPLLDWSKDFLDTLKKN